MYKNEVVENIKITLGELFSILERRFPNKLPMKGNFEDILVKRGNQEVLDYIYLYFDKKLKEVTK